MPVRDPDVPTLSPSKGFGDLLVQIRSSTLLHGGLRFRWWSAGSLKKWTDNVLILAGDVHLFRFDLIKFTF